MYIDFDGHHSGGSSSFFFVNENDICHYRNCLYNHRYKFSYEKEQVNESQYIVSRSDSVRIRHSGRIGNGGVTHRHLSLLADSALITGLSLRRHSLPLTDQEDLRFLVIDTCFSLSQRLCLLVLYAEPGHLNLNLDLSSKLVQPIFLYHFLANFYYPPNLWDTMLSNDQYFHTRSTLLSII